jgi:small-conductance mechanosensitive channel
MAVEAVAKLERVVDSRPPVCHLVQFGDSSLDFVLRFWIQDPEAGLVNIRGQALLALWDTFKTNKISIPYPHREVFVHQASPAATPKDLEL